MAVLTLQPDETSGIDTYIHRGNPTLNYGVATTILAGTGADFNSNTRGLIKFDLTSIPAGVTITSAILTLFCTGELSGTNHAVKLSRSLVAFFEGSQNGVAPSGGQDGSTWNNRNTNGSVLWTAGIGGGNGSDYSSTPTATTTVTGTGAAFTWDLTADVLNFYNGVQTNNGWWILVDLTFNDQKQFASSSNATAANRPKLVVTYNINSSSGATAGTSTVTGDIKGVANLFGSAAGTSSHNVQLISNLFSVGHGFGTATVTGRLSAKGKLSGNSFGDSTAIADIIADVPLQGEAAGTSAHVAHLKGVFRMQGLAAGTGVAIARLSSEGQMRGAAFGTSTATATGYARALNVTLVIGCNPVPLLHITDGSVKSNGQLNILDFLNERAGYLLINYKPQIAQYKDNGYWSSSPQSQGRRLRGKVFDNVIDLVEVVARAGSQDALIQYQQDLLDFQEAASDYWASDYAFLPFYMVARAARESNTRYALIHMISCPELENPFTQPFFDDAVGATFTSLMIRIEHGLWMSTPPGRSDCVEVSGQREWTVSGWQTGI